MKSGVNSFIYAQVLKGNATVNKLGSRCTAGPGDLMIFPPTDPPVIENISDDAEGYVLVVSTEFACELHDTRYLYQTLVLSHHQPDMPIIKLKEDEPIIAEQLFRCFMLHMQNPDKYTYDALQSLYGLFLSDLMGFIKKRGEIQISTLRSYKLMMDFHELLDENFPKHHDITFYADKLGISPRYLSMVCKEITHATVATIINKKIMYEACWLLRTTDYSISEISKRLNFSDQASFSKFFKRINGMPPLQFRRK